MNRGTHKRICKLEARSSTDHDENDRWVRVIVRGGETAEAAQERHFLEHPEDCGANVILRVIV
jgi:hypothetical protein